MRPPDFIIHASRSIGACAISTDAPGEAHAQATRAQLGAWNNAAWCDAICRAHGIPGRFTPRAWLNPRRTPPLYPDAITLAPDASAEEVLAAIDTSAGCSVKDSFASLDLTPAGFTVLFDAEWIYRPGELRPPTTSQHWSPVRTADELREWQRAWQRSNGPHEIFHAALLSDPTILVLGRVIANRFDAGAVAHRGDRTIGISNVFTHVADLRDTWAAALSATTRTWPGLPIVGYERGHELAAATEHGFTPSGPLKIWLRPGQT
jgi:hypothetical protein